MIKNFLIFLLVSFSFLFAEVTKKADIDSLLNKTNSIALGHIAVIEDRSIISTSTASLKGFGYLDSNFLDDNLFGGSISYTSNNTAIDINTNILSSSLTIEEKDYFLNQYKNAINSRKIYEKNGYIYVAYFYSKKAISNILNNNSQNDYIGDATPSSYSSPNSYETWWDSKDVLYNAKRYINGSFVNEDYNNQNLNYDGIYSNIKTVPLIKTFWNFTQVTATEDIKAVKCDNGANYNQIAQRCEAYTSNACDGNSFDVATGKCYKTPLNYCLKNGYSYYDNGRNKCNRTIYSNKINKITGWNFSQQQYGSAPSGGGYWRSIKLNYPVTISWTAYSEDSIVYIYKDGVSVFYWGGKNWEGACSSYVTSNGGCTAEMDYFGGTLIANTSFDLGIYEDGKWGTPIIGYSINFLTNSTVSPAEGASPIYSSSCIDSSWIDNGLNCIKTEYLTVPLSYGAEYFFVNNGIGGADAYIANTSCSGRVMSVSPFYSTPHYGNNGLCYSDVGLYCKNTSGLSYDGIYTCYKTNQSCDIGYALVYNFSGQNDKCTKQNYSCGMGQLYGLNTHSTNNNTLDLFNRIINKDTKVTTYQVDLLNGLDVIINDNNGAMCVELSLSTLSQSATAPNYTINSIQKSGF